MCYLKSFIFLFLGCAITTSGFSGIAGYYSTKPAAKVRTGQCPTNQPNCKTSTLK